MSSATVLTLRPATPADEHELVRLAALDSALQLNAPVLVAEAGGQLVAARSLRDGLAIADPFQATAGVVELLGQWAQPRRPARQTW